MTPPGEGSALDTRVQAFILSGYHGQPTLGTVTIHVFNRKQRWRRALAGLGKWGGMALLAVFIPVAHFLLVPSFLLYGTWQFFQRLQTVELAPGARGTCPDCGREQPLELGPRWGVPQSITCRYCHRGLRLALPAASPPDPSDPKCGGESQPEVPPSD
jgi:hypothetical protein